MYIHYFCTLYIIFQLLLEICCYQTTDSNHFCQIFQVKSMPSLVTKRGGHSMNIITLSHSCVWLLVMGGYPADSNLVFLELSKYHNLTTKKKAYIYTINSCSYM